MSKAIPSVLPGNGSPEIEFEEHASAEEEEDEEEEEEIDELQALTQRLNKEIDKSQYDPSQDKSQRRTIRQRYRELIQSAEGMFLPSYPTSAVG
jgi:acetyl-CoA carboxylase carboxyltransferase component